MYDFIACMCAFVCECVWLFACVFHWFVCVFCICVCVCVFCICVCVCVFCICVCVCVFCICVSNTHTNAKHTHTNTNAKHLCVLHLCFTVSHLVHHYSPHWATVLPFRACEELHCQCPIQRYRQECYESLTAMTHAPDTPQPEAPPRPRSHTHTHT